MFEAVTATAKTELAAAMTIAGKQEREDRDRPRQGARRGEAGLAGSRAARRRSAARSAR